jgi:hypothetical protein
MRHPGILSAALVCALPTLVGAAQAEPLAIPPQQFAFEVLAIPLTLPITADIDVVADGEKRVATGGTVGNLGDLQAKAVAIARALPLPKEQCANDGINVVVDSIQDASIVPEGNAARLTIAGFVTAYGCIMGLGAPIASTQMAISAPVVFDVVSPTDIGLKLAGPVELVAAGLPAEVTALLSVQVNGVIQSALAQARTQGPMAIDGLPDLKIEIANAEFFAEGETLMVRLEGTSRMNAETFDALVTELGATAPAGL